MIMIGTLASSISTGESAQLTALRQYVAGDPRFGMSPRELRGQPQILKPGSPRPETIVMR